MKCILLALLKPRYNIQPLACKSTSSITTGASSSHVAEEAGELPEVTFTA